MKHKTRKHFGFTDGYNGKDGISTPTNGRYCVKGVDYIKYDYPFDNRTKREKQFSDEKKILKQQLTDE
jgi:hypothetical protein